MTCKYCLLSGVGDTFTSGFPSLDEIRGNGSLLNDGVFSTHDGEIRSVPGVRFTCNGRITKITFIALPGVGNRNSVFAVIRPNDGTGTGIVRYSFGTSGATDSFGDFRYETVSVPDVQFQGGDTLRINLQPYNMSRLRILHQRGDEELDICWKPFGVNVNYTCGLDYDYPLLAIETGMDMICVYQCVFSSLNLWRCYCFVIPTDKIIIPHIQILQAVWRAH